MMKPGKKQRLEPEISQLLGMMQDFSPIIPDTVVDHLLMEGGFQTSDLRIKRLLALATQKFISDIATDALHYAKTRQATQMKQLKQSKSDKKTVMTMEDLSNAMSEHGVNLRKPEYYQ